MLISLLIVVVLLLSACGQQPAAVTEEQPAASQEESAPADDAKSESEEMDADEPTDEDAEADKDEAGSGEDKTLVIAVSGDIAGWDPAATIYWLANEVLINTHDTLIDYAPGTDEDGNPVRNLDEFIPGLAEDWEASDDGTVFTFKLRENAKFNNGDPVNAEAVKASFVRLFDIPGLASFLLSDVALVKSADQIETPDEYTVVFNLPQSNPLFLKVMQEVNMAVTNAALIEQEGGAGEEGSEWASNNVTGTGPYIVEEFKAGEQLVLAASPTYWGEPPEYSKVIYKVVPAVENRLAMLERGDVDVVYEPPLKDYASLKDNADVTAYAVPTYGTLYFWVGLNEEPWKSNVQLREALMYAMPYQTIIDEVSYGYARPAAGWVPFGLDGYMTETPYEYDPEKAAALLEEAGYAGGEGLPPIKFYLKQGNPEEEQVIVYIQAELQSLGVSMEIEPLSLAAHSERQSQHDLPFSFNYWIPYVPDTGYHLYWNWYTADSGCCNYSSYSNEELDELITQVMQELDTDTRVSIIGEVQNIIAENPDRVAIYHPTWNVAMKSSIKGYTYYPDTLLRFAQLTSE